MLYYLLYPLRNMISGFNVFRYITFRTAWAALTALVISFILGPWLIERMRQIKLGQFIREEGPKSHQQKAGTPTMGGILINVLIVAYLAYRFCTRACSRSASTAGGRPQVAPGSHGHANRDEARLLAIRPNRTG